jgi:hypothetical protein
MSDNASKEHTAAIANINEETKSLDARNEAVKKNIQSQINSINLRRDQVPGVTGGDIAGSKGEAPESGKGGTGKKGKGGGGKGGGADAEQNRLNSLFDTLTKEEASLSGGKAAEIYANLDKTLAQIQGKAEHRAVDQAEVEVLARSVAAKKIEKLYEDQSLWVAKEYGDQTASLNAEEAEKLKTVRYTGEMSHQDQLKLWNLQQGIREVYTKKRIANDLEIADTELNSQKTYLDALASASPYLEDQLILKKKSLELENQLAQDAITKLMLQKEELRGYEDIFRQRQKEINQAKKYNLEMENNKGFQGWAYGRSKEAGQRDTFKDMMGGAENFIQQGLSSGIQGVLSKDKDSLKNIGKTIVQGFIGEMTKRSVTQVFDKLAELTTPKKGIGGSIPAGGSAGNLEQLQAAAAAGSVEAAKQLNASAGSLKGSAENLGLSGAELGLSAGGLLLSGIGIMTNSQALVTAGMVLQIGGLAIQTAASLLMIAAAVDAIPFFHGGGMITAHQGWPRLAPDERVIRAQIGERVLSRAQNRDYEAGRPGGSVGGGDNHIHYHDNRVVNAMDARGVEAVLSKHGKHLVKVLKRETGNKVSG